TSQLLCLDVCLRDAFA
ncbi:DUF645 family protein, partial [Vibrio cholerae]|nr:DUF645 family protein [Vibrio cholerae]